MAFENGDRLPWGSGYELPPCETINMSAVLPPQFNHTSVQWPNNLIPHQQPLDNLERSEPLNLTDDASILPRSMSSQYHQAVYLEEEPQMPAEDLSLEYELQYPSERFDYGAQEPALLAFATHSTYQNHTLPLGGSQGSYEMPAKYQPQHYVSSAMPYTAQASQQSDGLMQFAASYPQLPAQDHAPHVHHDVLHHRRHHHHHHSASVSSNNLQSRLTPIDLSDSISYGLPAYKLAYAQPLGNLQETLDVSLPSLGRQNYTARSNWDLFNGPPISPIVFHFTPSPIESTFSEKFSQGFVDSPFPIMACACGMPDDDEMVVCSGYKHLKPKVLHVHCAGLQAPPSRSEKWLCMDCHSPFSFQSEAYGPIQTAVEKTPVQVNTFQKETVSLRKIKLEDNDDITPFTPDRLKQAKGLITKPSALYKQSTSFKVTKRASGSRVGMAKGTAWTANEENACIEIMKDIRTSGTCRRIDSLWEAVSRRMLDDEGINRSAAAIKNCWNRKLRAKSGFDERRTPKPNSLRTGLLSSAKK